MVFLVLTNVPQYERWKHLRGSWNWRKGIREYSLLFLQIFCTFPSIPKWKVYLWKSIKYLLCMLDVLEDTSYLKNMSRIKMCFHVLSFKLPWQPARQSRWDYFHWQCMDEEAETMKFYPQSHPGIKQSQVVAPPSRLLLYLTSFSLLNSNCSDSIGSDCHNHIGSDWHEIARF